MNAFSTAPLPARVEAATRTARAWREPEHGPRAEAVRRTLEAAPNRFTEEALAFAVNAATHALTPEALQAWVHAAPPLARGASATPAVVAAAPPEEGAPLGGLYAALAVVLAGHRCVFCAPEDDPALVPAFMRAVCAEIEGDAREAFATAASLPAALEAASAALSGGEEAARPAFEEACTAAGLPPDRRFWQDARYAVAVLDGTEPPEGLEALAEDALLYEGRGSASVRLLWAPAGAAPDTFLDALARFRAVFPAHEDTPGALQMQKAFLEARDQSHAHGDGLEFLVSRGAPEVQARGHLRWAEYEGVPPGGDLSEVRTWLEAHAGDVHTVVAPSELAAQLPGAPLAPGNAHRQGLEAPEAQAARAFVAAL